MRGNFLILRPAEEFHKSLHSTPSSIQNTNCGWNWMLDNWLCVRLSFSSVHELKHFEMDAPKGDESWNLKVSIDILVSQRTRRRRALKHTPFMPCGVFLLWFYQDLVKMVAWDGSTPIEWKRISCSIHRNKCVHDIFVSSLSHEENHEPVVERTQNFGSCVFCGLDHSLILSKVGS